MASQSLYRKWRSQAFAEMVGQDAVIRTLKNALGSGNLAHAYLFAGPRGTGKTTTARLLAKTINCLHPKDGEPCNSCQQCREITAGNSFNVIEIDAASNRGIDSIRELREKVMMPPATGRYKVYILDEAHMLTTEAFNALLKTLEEPPEHAIFVLATTDVHKMLPTVLSRCQRFDFKRFTVRQIIGHLNFIAEQEHVALERGAAELIARAAAGGMRDALSLLDQAIAYSGQEITLAQVQAMLGVADPRAIQKFILSIAQLDSPGGLRLIHELVEAGADLRQINTQIAEYWRAMMLVKAGANVAEILDNTEDEIREIVETTRFFRLDEIMECARIFAQNDLVQRNQGTPQLGLELALLAGIELHRQGQGEQPARVAMARPPAAVSSARTPQPPPVPTHEVPRPASAASRSPTPVNDIRPAIPAAPAQEERPAVAPETRQQEPGQLPDWDNVSSSDDEMEEAVLLDQMAPANDGAIEDTATEQDTPPAGEHTEQLPSLTVAQVKERWELIKRRVKTRSKSDGALVAAVLNDYTIVSIEGTEAVPVLVIQANADFHFKALQKPERHKVIVWALGIELGQECELRLLPPGPSAQPIPFPAPAPFVPGNGSSRGANPPRGGEVDSASRGRSAPHRPANPPQKQEQRAPGNGQEPAPPVDSASSASSAHQDPPLARTDRVRENNNTVSSPTRDAGETRLVSVKKKATGDPVVQEAARIFKAEIKDIHLK
jgi:DNA polymerase-3 subunit gamma/tau